MTPQRAAADELELPFPIPLATTLPAVGPDPIPEFADADSARRALVIHAVAAHQLADERPTLLLAARAVGVADQTIREITGVTGSEIDELPARPSVPVAQPALRDQYAALLYHRAMGVGAIAALLADAAQREYLSGYADAAYQEAAGLRTGGQAEPFGDMLLSRATQLRAYTALLRDEGSAEQGEIWRRRGWFDAAGRIAAELAILRAQGADALDSMFTAQEMATAHGRPGPGRTVPVTTAGQSGEPAL